MKVFYVPRATLSLASYCHFIALHPVADVLQSACWWSGKGLQLEYPEVAMHIPIVWLTYRLCPTSGNASDSICVMYYICRFPHALVICCVLTTVRWCKMSNPLLQHYQKALSTLYTHL